MAMKCCSVQGFKYSFQTKTAQEGIKVLILQKVFKTTCYIDERKDLLTTSDALM